MRQREKPLGRSFRNFLLLGHLFGLRDDHLYKYRHRDTVSVYAGAADTNAISVKLKRETFHTRHITSAVPYIKDNAAEATPNCSAADDIVNLRVFPQDGSVSRQGLYEVIGDTM